VAIIQKDIPEIESLRDVTELQLQFSKEKLPANIYKRCKHVILENQRVQLATKAMLNGNHRKVGELLYASHLSLQNDYNVSCRELDFLVGETIDKDNVLGSRMMGGGFGGCTLNIIDTAYVQQFIDEVTNSYYNKFGIELTPYLVSIEDGAQLVH
jgi:galactokinase